MSDNVFFAHKNPHRTYLFRKSEGEEHVFNPEYPRGVQYRDKYDVIRIGQQVKPGEYIMKDLVGEYPKPSHDFHKTFDIVGEGIAKMRNKEPEWRKMEFLTTRRDQPPIHEVGDVRSFYIDKNGVEQRSQYPINQKAFMDTYVVDMKTFTNFDF
jgi:hypothetical protein